jgi:PKD domain
MRPNKSIQTIFLSIFMALLTACTSAVTRINRVPIISSFRLEPFADKALTARFFWEFSDADGDHLTCTLTDGAGEVEVFSTAACASPLTTSTNYRVETTYKQAGTYTASLKLEDGQGGSVTATATVMVK